MADMKAPENDPLLEFWHETGIAIIRLSALKPLLAHLGFHIVSEADRKVLEASSAVHQRWLESYVNIIVPTQADPQAFAWAQAELKARKTRTP